MPEIKPARRKIKTIGDLRGVLAEAIESVMSGEMDGHAATAVVKLASQINNSLLAEVEVARFTLAQTNAIAALGSLPLEFAASGVRQTIDAEHDDSGPKSLTPSANANALAAAAAMQVAKAARQPALAARITDHRQSGVVEMPGMPPPGRSALDQRRTAS